MSFYIVILKIVEKMYFYNRILLIIVIHANVLVPYSQPTSENNNGRQRMHKNRGADLNH